MSSLQQRASPADSDFSFFTDYRSSISSNRSSVSTAPSCFSPPPPLAAKTMETGGLATPTTPGGYQHAPRAPMQLGAVPPSPPQLQPLSTLAMFAGELFVWLWFAPPNDASQGSSASIKASKQQLAPSERFLRFCHDVLSTTQVSHSVVILGLLFISRLKAKNHIHGSPGSEFRASVTALMLANKVLDDNTYTAKTWADVSALELKPLVAGEAEFLRGLDWNLHVTERDFASWLKLLEGLVAARNSQVRRSSRKVGTKHGRNVVAGNGGTELLGLGLGVGLSFPAGGSSIRPTKRAREEEGDRRRVSGGGATLPAGINTTNNTPQSKLASFSFPSTFSAPHLAPSTAPLQSAAFNGASNAVSPLSSRPQAPQDFRRPSRGHRHTQSIPPAVTTSDALRPNSKRRAEDAFAAEETSPTALDGPAAKRLQAAYLSRSFSAGSSPAPQRAVFVHPGHSFPSQPQFPPPSWHNISDRAIFPPPPPLPHGLAPEMGRQMSSGRRREGGRRETLADGFSPRYDPRQGVRVGGLDFYSLGSKQQYHAPPPFVPQQAATRPAAYIPVHPSHLSTTTSPALSPLSMYHTSYGAPFKSDAHSPPDSFLSTTPKGFISNPPQPQHQYRRSSAPQQAHQLPSAFPPRPQFANNGLPGIFWQG